MTAEIDFIRAADLASSAALLIVISVTPTSSDDVTAPKLSDQPVKRRSKIAGFTLPADIQQRLLEMGLAIEPLIKLLGYDWKIGFGILSRLPHAKFSWARCRSLIPLRTKRKTPPALREVMLAEKHPDGSPVYTPLVCVG